MIRKAEEMDLYWLVVILVVCYVFQFRVFSEFFKVVLDDIAFVEEAGTNELRITVNGRKNRPYRHELRRPCSCEVKPQKGKVPLGKLLCVYHVLQLYLVKGPAYILSRDGRLEGATLLQDVAQRTVNPLLKQVARECGDPFADKAGSHGMRRGMACDMALHGATLSDILVGGDWRSSALRAYIESVKEDLAGKALVQLCGECSDSDINGE